LIHAPSEIKAIKLPPYTSAFYTQGPTISQPGR
jgi:hypothetical protein